MSRQNNYNLLWGKYDIFIYNSSTKSYAKQSNQYFIEMVRTVCYVLPFKAFILCPAVKKCISYQ